MASISPLKTHFSSRLRSPILHSVQGLTPLRFQVSFHGETKSGNRVNSSVKSIEFSIQDPTRLRFQTPIHGEPKSRERASSAIQAMDFSADGSSSQPQRISLEALKDLIDGLPLPVRKFPWMEAFGEFLRLIIGLFFTVVKFLSVPVLLVSSLSEMSYCAHERKMMAIPIPFLFGLAVGKVLEETALEISPSFKEVGFPWHLVLMAAFFILVKLPGPYYPYWGRLVLPHFANGGLSAVIWSAFIWFRKSARPVANK